MSNEEENIEDLEALSKRGLELFNEDYNESLDELMPATIESDEETKVVKLNGNWRRWISIAAILLIGTIGLLMLNTPTVNGVELYANHLEVPPYVISKVVRGVENSDVVLTQLEKFYEQGDYKKYISSVENMENRPPETLLYEAISYMQLGQMEEAINLLSDSKTIPPELNDIRLWNLGLCHLRNEDYQSSKKVFNGLIDNYNYKKSQAQEILKLIENY